MKVLHWGQFVKMHMFTYVACVTGPNSHLIIFFSRDKIECKGRDKDSGKRIHQKICGSRMGDFKHLAVVKFKPGIQVADILKGVQDLMSSLVDIVKSFEWGEDLESHEMGRQGFTHVFAVTFRNKEDYKAYVRHPEHVKFSAVFAEAVDKVAVLDFLGVSVVPTVAIA